MLLSEASTTWVFSSFRSRHRSLYRPWASYTTRQPAAARRGRRTSSRMKSAIVKTHPSEIQMLAAVADDDLFLTCQPLKMHPQSLGQTVLHAVLQVLFHENVAPAVAERAATLAIVAQDTGFVGCISVLPKHRLSLLIAFAVGKVLPILRRQLMQKLVSLGP